ncbi:Nucleolin 2 [Vitis vinifera]|uniref:Nucleolin 2 n=1 Tax=Vitis vinifera TaxID=29760 RepID=A0A438FXJ8_VITVI|nr:Nucleolin 2 [Vitis vinifera]
MQLARKLILHLGIFNTWWLHIEGWITVEISGFLCCKVASQAKKLPPSSQKNVPEAAPKKAESSDSSDGSDSDEEKPTVAKNVAAAAPKKKVQSSDSSSETSSEEEEEPQKKPSPKEDIDEEDSADESDEEPQKRKLEVPTSVSSSAGKSSSSEEESSDSEDEPSKVPLPKKATQVSKKSIGPEEDSSEEESNEEVPSKTPKKNDTDVEMSTGSKTLFVSNLSFSIQKEDVEHFFKDAGEVVDVRFSSDADGRFKGFGHVEFATPEAAQKALKVNGKDLLGRAVRSTLEEYFGSCGEVSRISIPKDYESDSVKEIADMDFTDDQPTSLVHSPTTKLCHFGTKCLGICDDNDLLYEDFNVTPVAVAQFLLQLSILVLIPRRHLPAMSLTSSMVLPSILMASNHLFAPLSLSPNGTDQSLRVSASLPVITLNEGHDVIMGGIIMAKLSLEITGDRYHQKKKSNQRTLVRGMMFHHNSNDFDNGLFEADLIEKDFGNQIAGMDSFGC